MALYPRMVPSVGFGWISESDLALLGKLASELPAHCDGTLESVVTPRVSELVGVGFVVMETGAEFSGRVRRMILEQWKSAGAGEELLAVLRAAQVQLMPRVSFEEGGMVPESRKPASIGPIGRRRVPRKKVLDLLDSLRECHKNYWPLEQLANIVEPVARLTR